MMSRENVSASQVTPSSKHGAMQRRFSAVTISLQGLLLIAAFVALVPVYFIVISSLKTPQAYLDDRIGFPTQIVFDNYNTVLSQHPFFLWMGNSTLISVGPVLVSTVISALAAYAIARMRFWGREFLMSLSTSLMAVPPVVMVVPLFVLFSQIGLPGKYQGVILIYASLMCPFSVYLLVTFFRTIPKSPAW